MIEDQKVKHVLLIAPAAKTNSQTASASFDFLGADYATIRIGLASEINTNAVGPTISLLHSDDTVVTNHVTMVADRTTEDITAAKMLVYQVDLKTAKRYGRLVINNGTATNDNITVSADLTLSRLEETPSSTSEMVGSTNDVVVQITSL